MPSPIGHALAGVAEEALQDRKLAWAQGYRSTADGHEALRLVDAATGEFERGIVRVADMAMRQPWDDTVPVQVTWSAAATTA